MRSMNNLDLMVQEICMTPEEYEDNKAMVSIYLNGELSLDQLPQHLKDVIFQWEAEETQLELQTA